MWKKYYIRKKDILEKEIKEINLKKEKKIDVLEKIIKNIISNEKSNNLLFLINDERGIKYGGYMSSK